MINSNNQLIFTKWCIPVAIFGALQITIFGAYSITDYKQVVRSFDFVGLNSQAGYDSDFWRKDRHVPATLYSEISRSLSTKIPLEKQFRDNSGKRWQEWDRDKDTPQSVFSAAKDFDEGVEKHENLVNNIREKRFRNVYEYLKMKKDESN